MQPHRAEGVNLRVAKLAVVLVVTLESLLGEVSEKIQQYSASRTPAD